MLSQTLLVCVMQIVLVRIWELGTRSERWIAENTAEARVVYLIVWVDKDKLS